MLTDWYAVAGMKAGKRKAAFIIEFAKRCAMAFGIDGYLPDRQGLTVERNVAGDWHQF